MHLRALRRPSAPLVVSFVALFVALGGAGWAAIRVPVNSVGNAQLRSNSVGPRKIIPGSVGAVQVNSSQVQLRVAGPCTAGAIQSIAVSGDVTCTQALPNEYGVSPPAMMLGPGTTQVASEPLVGTSSDLTYLVIGNVRLDATELMSGAQAVQVSCTLSIGHFSTGGGFTAELASDQTAVSGAIPVVIPVGLSAPVQATLSCDNSSPSTVTVTVAATINAIQTATNN